jgi:hypothetical protein
MKVILKPKPLNKVLILFEFYNVLDIQHTLKSKLAHVEEVLYHMESAVFAETVTDCQQLI